MSNPLPVHRKLGAAAIGALLFGVAWYSVGVAYQAEHAQPPKQPSAEQGVASPKENTPDPTVVIEGPPTAPLGKTTYFTILSENAVRGEWSAGGFQDNKVFTVDPLGPSHQIYIEPTDPTRVGEPFTLSVTVYGADGRSAICSEAVLGCALAHIGVDLTGVLHGQLCAGRYPAASAACGLGNGTRLSGEMSE